MASNGRVFCVLTIMCNAAVFVRMHFCDRFSINCKPPDMCVCVKASHGHMLDPRKAKTRSFRLKKFSRQSKHFPGHLKCIRLVPLPKKTSTTSNCHSAVLLWGAFQPTKRTHTERRLFFPISRRREHRKARMGGEAQKTNIKYNMEQKCTI